MALDAASLVRASSAPRLRDERHPAQLARVPGIDAARALEPRDETDRQVGARAA